MDSKVINRQQNSDSLSSPEAIKSFAGYFELLSKIDQRLKKEDLEYRAKYYTKEKFNENN